MSERERIRWLGFGLLLLWAVLILAAHVLGPEHYLRGLWASAGVACAAGIVVLERK